jgi:hypothetical protein
MKISLACLTLNLLLAAALVVPLKQGGLGIANTITSVFNAGLLFFALRKKLGRLEMAPLRATFLPLSIAGLLAGLVAWQGWQLWETTLGHATLALKIGAVFLPAVADVQGSGGEGNAGICADKIQKAKMNWSQQREQSFLKQPAENLRRPFLRWPLFKSPPSPSSRCRRIAI